MAVQLYALGGIARAGATRSNWHSPNLFVSIAGVQYAKARLVPAQKVRNETLSITDTLNESPNTASLITQGFIPSTGQEVIVTLGSINNLRREFGGQILAVGQSFVGTTANDRHALSLIDFTWGLNKRKVRERYTATTVGAIAADLMSTYASGYTLAVAADIADEAIDEITFTEEDLTACLSRLTERVGGEWVCTYDKVVKLFYEDTSVTHPTMLTVSHPTLEKASFAITRDLSQILTRVYVEGGGANAITDVAVGETSLPVENGAWYSPAGGVVVSGPQRIAYAGLQLGGGGGLVGPGAFPSSAPVAALAAGSGVETGVHDYAATFITASGESLPGPRVTIAVGVVAAPLTAPTTGTPTVGGSVTAGAHDYAVTFVTAAGETTPSPVSGSVTTVAPAATPSPVPSPFGSEQTYTNSMDRGEVLYRWKYTFQRTADGAETDPSGASNSFWMPDVDADAGYIARSLLSNCATPPAGYVLKWYRTHGGGSTYFAVTGGFISGTPARWYDGSSDASLGAAIPSSNATALATVPLTNIPLGGALVTSRKLYRRFNGTGTYKLVTTIANNTATTFSDTIANGSLGADAPSSNTATANQISLTSVPIGGATVTSRKLYRTVAAGSQLKLLATIADNTTTVYTDSTADASLGANVPTSDTSGITQPNGQVVAGSTTLQVASAVAFASGGGRAIIGNGEQGIRYTGLSGNTLTGIPASGPGSIVASIGYNSTITAAPTLTGIPASGTGSIRFPILKGDAVNLFVQVDDVAAQAALAALIGGDGIQEDTLQDRRLSHTEATAKGEAWVALKRDVALTIKYQTRDLNARAGSTQPVSLGAPFSVTGDFLVQSVTESGFKPARFPVFDCTASSARVTFDDLLRAFRKAA